MADHAISTGISQGQLANAIATAPPSPTCKTCLVNARTCTTHIALAVLPLLAGATQALQHDLDAARGELDRAHQATEALLAERNTWARQMADLRDERDTAFATAEKTRHDAHSEIKERTADLTRIVGLLARERDLDGELDIVSAVEHALRTRRVAIDALTAAEAVSTNG